MAESVLVDQSRVNSRRSPSIAVNDVADSGGFMVRSRHMSLNSYSSFVGGGTGFMSHGSSSHHLQQQQQPPPPSVYGTTLHASFYNDQKLAHQPPLLPLPSANKPPGLVPSSPKITRTNTGMSGAFRSMKPRPPVNSVPRNAAAAGSRAREHPKAVEKLAIAQQKDEEAELVRMESIYSLSPPPSNLPLPSFLLARHKAACKDQVLIGGSAAGGY